MTENEMVGWHHQLNGHEFEHILGDSEGQGSLACYSPWRCKELETTEQLNNSKEEEEPSALCSGSDWWDSQQWISEPGGQERILSWR